VATPESFDERLDVSTYREANKSHSAVVNGNDDRAYVSLGGKARIEPEVATAVQCVGTLRGEQGISLTIRLEMQKVDCSKKNP